MKYLSPLLLISALFINGCSSVINATSEEPIDLDPSKRTVGTMIDDEQLETIAKVNIKKASPILKTAHINATSYNGVILLTGQVPNAAERQLAADTVNRLAKVRQVYNELQIQGKTSILARSNDTWLTAKVKSRLLADKSIKSGRIKVVTESGVVYLMGLLTTAQADAAAEVARTTGGVQKVVKAVEYIN